MVLVVEDALSPCVPRLPASEDGFGFVLHVLRAAADDLWTVTIEGRCKRLTDISAPNPPKGIDLDPSRSRSPLDRVCELWKNLQVDRGMADLNFDSAVRQRPS